MMNRRAFLGTMGAGAAALAASRFSWAAATHKIDKIGVQLYTVRDEMKKDFEGTLAKISQLGYREVEFAGYFGHSPNDVKAILERNHLTSPSSHVPYELLGDKWQQTLDDAKTVGNSFIVCPWINENLRNPEGLKQVSETFNKAAEASQKAGLQFAYHNHNFEFVKVNGAVLYDTLLQQTDPKLVKMEMDLCWAEVGGVDPVDYFNKYPGRFPLVHVKDMKTLPAKGSADAGGDPSKLHGAMADVGSGIIDWKRIFAAGEKGGIQHYFVEHDEPKDAWATLKNGEMYLKQVRF